MSLRCTTTHLSYNFYLKPAIYYHKFKWVAFLQVEQNYVEYYCFKLVGSFLLDTDPRLKSKLNYKNLYNFLHGVFWVKS